ncbi:heterokaryon incompatibility protein [Grosmannia clavigera kw1407]|uniref:Heterokaryon incompatibility protein n=1 Tax=Grosmannia clavigera (strain kw1407 / UAMH 11150) TaxID=655863 RepID=F0XQM2_GROCL|nr:heterokaryon incompatibility protein [Grosmannia clavigera kw1407]EFW99939.1 heterokaryon incompatibility protein [Grosmannia clavigera kw1407]
MSKSRRALDMSLSLYRSLPNNGDTFRLAELQPGREGDPVVLTLLPKLLSQGDDYEALSYVWSSAENEAKVLVNGMHVPIRRSLFEFFTVLRSSKQPRLLYADAICINQVDDKERTQQVRLMQDIYKNASKVLAWLGPGSPATDLLLRVAATTSAGDYSPNGSGENDGGTWRRPPEADDPSVWTSLQATLRLVLDQPYWRRAWIIQECLLARQLYFSLGTAQVSWDSFSSAHMMLLEKRPVARGYTWGYLYDTITRFDHLAGLKNRSHEFPIPLSGIVRRFSAAESTDPRDMIFAFSALVAELQPGHPGGLEVDYGLSTVSLYFRAGYASLISDSRPLPHRTLHGLRTMLRLTSLELLETVMALIDPDELLSAVSWLVGDWDPQSTPQGRTFRDERKHEGLAYIDCHVADFSTLVRLLNEKERAGR